MNQKAYLTLIKTNILRRKKNVAISIIILCVSFLILLITSTLSLSISTFLDRFLLNTLDFRTLNIGTFKLQEGQREGIQQAVKDNPYIIDFYDENFGAKVIVNDDKLLNLAKKISIDKAELSLHSYTRAYDDYLLMGEGINDDSTNVGIIPNLFYPSTLFQIGFWKETNQFIDGESLIGKDITIEYYARDYSTDKMDIIKTFTYTFRVIGTYDILPNNDYPYKVFIPFEDMQYIIDNIDTYNLGLSENYNKTYNIVVDDEEHVNDIIIYMEQNGFSASPKAVLTEYYTISKKIIFTGYMLGIILLFFSLINIILTIGKTIRNRTSEIGLMKTIGYNNNQLMFIYLLETIIIGIISFIISVTIYIIAIAVINNILANNISMYSQKLKLLVNYKQIIINLIFAIVLPFLSSIMSCRSILNITPLVAINKGDD